MKLTKQLEETRTSKSLPDQFNKPADQFNEPGDQFNEPSDQFNNLVTSSVNQPV